MAVLGRLTRHQRRSWPARPRRVPFKRSDAMSMKHNPAVYNPVEHVTPDEAERNKRIMGKNQAHQDGKQEDDIPGTDKSVKTPDTGKATA